MLPWRGNGRAHDYGGQPWAREITRTPEEPVGDELGVSRCFDGSRSWPNYPRVFRYVESTNY